MEECNRLSVWALSSAVDNSRLHFSTAINIKKCVCALRAVWYVRTRVCIFRLIAARVRIDLIEMLFVWLDRNRDLMWTTEIFLFGGPCWIFLHFKCSCPFALLHCLCKCRIYTNNITFMNVVPEPLVGNQYLLDTLALVYILYSFYLMPTICHLSRCCCCCCCHRTLFTLLAWCECVKEWVWERDFVCLLLMCHHSWTRMN